MKIHPQATNEHLEIVPKVFSIWPRTFGTVCFEIVPKVFSIWPDFSREPSGRFRRQATKGHWIVGITLILLSLGSVIANLILDTQILPFLVFFFGVWGGVETGRYLEAWISKRHA